MSSRTEDDMIKALDEQSLWDELKPVIKAAMAIGGGADEILRKSQAMAAKKMVEALFADKPETSLRAAEKILDRALGRPVERKLDIYANITDLNERELDSQIMKLMKEIGTTKVLDSAIDGLPQMKAAKKKRKRKARKTKIHGTTS